MQGASGINFGVWWQYDNFFFFFVNILWKKVVINPKKIDVFLERYIILYLEMVLLPFDFI